MQGRKKQNKSNKNDSALGIGAGEIRIIGGEWRSRKLIVPDVAGLRPTTDRVRETLFNWLQAYIHNSHCLDVCAGSGALGFEALSRGAASVHFVEMSKKATQMIAKNAQNLGVPLAAQSAVNFSIESSSATDNQAIIHQGSALDFLAGDTSSQRFDIVFVDPPFALSMHTQIFAALQQGQWLAEDALLYCEMPANDDIELPDGWHWFREKRTKNLAFGLIQI